MIEYFGELNCVFENNIFIYFIQNDILFVCVRLDVVVRFNCLCVFVIDFLGQKFGNVQWVDYFRFVQGIIIRLCWEFVGGVIYFI